MLGLIKKDLLMIKSSMKIFLAVIIIYAIISIIEGENYGFSIIPAFTVFIMLSTFSYDEFNKSDAYISTMPCGKKNVVKAKYLTTIILFAMATILSTCFSVILSIYKKDFDLSYCIETSLGVTIGISIFQSLFYPMIYKYGIEKSRIGIFVVVFSLIGLGAFLSKLNIHINIAPVITNFFDNFWFIIIPILAATIIYISYRISTRIYIKKEF